MFKVVDIKDDNFSVLDIDSGKIDVVSKDDLLKAVNLGIRISNLESQKYSFVLDNRGVLLSPTKEQKAWYMIRHGKAKLIRINPMVIRLLREQDNTDMSYFKIGIDPGDTTGITIIQESHLKMSNNKAVFKAEIIHRNDIKKKMDVRREYRRYRRAQKRYRKPRFNNRSSSKRGGRVAPSIKNKKDEIFRVLSFLLKYIDISGIYIEDVSFDVRALVEGYKPYRWEYQKSNRLDENIRKAVILRDGCKCKMCGVSNTRLEVHHITPKRKGGNNTLNNLITLCSSCHSEVTNKEDDYKDYFYGLINGKQISLAPAMHVMLGKRYLYSRLGTLVSEGNVYLTTGGDTANSRLDWGIQKSHTNDAACITDVRCLPINLNTYVWKIKPQRRKIRTKQDTSNLDIRHRDLVWYKPRGRERVKCYVTAIMMNKSNFGKYKLRSLSGEFFGPVSKNSLVLINNSNLSLKFF